MDPATIVMIVSASVGTITALLGLTGGSIAALGYINNKFKISYQISKIYQDRKDKAKLQQDLVNLFEKVPIEKDIVDEEPQQVSKPDVKVEQQVEEPEEPQVQEQQVKKTSRISGFLREAQPDCKPLDPKIAIAATAIWTFLLTSI